MMIDTCPACGGKLYTMGIRELGKSKSEVRRICIPCFIAKLRADLGDSAYLQSIVDMLVAEMAEQDKNNG